MLRVLRHPGFRRLWMAQVVSQSGDWLNRVAVLALIGRLSGPRGVLGVGLLYAVELAIRLMPTALLSPIAGPVADRLPRRLVMITADLTRAAVVLCLLFVRGPEDKLLLYGLLLVQMSLGIFHSASREASIPNTVPAAELHEAYALSAATWSTVLAFGAALGGVLVRWIGPGGVFVVDAATYVVSATLIARTTLPPTPRQPEPFRLRDVLLFVELRRALQHVRELGLVPVVAAKTFWGGAGGYLVLLSVFGRERFGGAGEEVEAAGFATGMLYAARGLGTGLGPILARRFLGSSDESLLRQITASFLVAAAGYAMFARASELWLACTWVAVGHMGGSTIWVASTTLWQRKVDDRFRGRVFALEFLGMTVAFTLSGFLAGWLFDRSGSLEHTTWAMSVLVVVLGLAWTVYARGPRRAARVAAADGP